MTEECNDTEIPEPEKLLIDNPSDFQFHAAYLAYSETYDKTTNPETKTQLNSNIEALQQDKIDYRAFYNSISKYREEVASSQSRRPSIRTQKKREWRRKTQKSQRNKRHKK